MKKINHSDCNNARNQRRVVSDETAGKENRFPVKDNRFVLRRRVLLRT